MLKIGRYGIAFGRVLWFQTQVPTRVWHFLWFWFLKEARPHDVDKVQQFLTGTPLQHEGRVYRYWKAETNINQPGGEEVGGKEVRVGEKGNVGPSNRTEHISLVE